MKIKLREKTLNGKFIEYCNYVISGGYILNEANEEQYRKFIMTIYEKKYGIILFGNPGNGKTFLFDVMQKIMNPQSECHFTKVNALDVVRDYNNFGHEIFERWRNQNVLFDDLGTETKGVYYGDKIEVFEKFIQFRYDLYRSKGFLTHYTTNLLPCDIELRYTKRCISRLNEMCEFIALPDIDYRQEKNFKGFIPVFHEKIKSAEDLEWEKNYREFCKSHEGKQYIPTQGGGSGTILRNYVNQILKDKV